MLYRSIVAGTFAAVLLLWGGPAAWAQEAYATVTVTPELREIGEDYFGGYLQVYANGELCGELSFTDPGQRTPNGGAEFELGSDGQPSSCSRAGATISFFDGNLVGLSNRYTLVPGTRIELTWFQFGAVRDDLDEGPSADGRTFLTIDPELRGVRGDLDYLEIAADGRDCGRFAFKEAAASTPGGGAEFELGQPGQPEACGRDGAIVSLTYPSGVRLSAVYRLTIGQRIAIQNFTIPPPHTGNDDDAAPGPPAAGGGLVAEPAHSRAQAAVGVATVLLLAGIVVYVVTRQHALRR